jgi:hypothetical protein
MNSFFKCKTQVLLPLLSALLTEQVWWKSLFDLLHCSTAVHASQNIQGHWWFGGFATSVFCKLPLHTTLHAQKLKHTKQKLQHY